MSTFTYHKPGIGNVSSYIVSGTPWYTSSLAPALSTTSTVVNLPRVTNSITIKNTSTTGDVLRFTLNNDNIVDNTNYITLEDGESFSAELRVVDVQLISDTETPVPFTILAGLTNIDRKEMYGTVPKAPNLLSWVEKQKLTASGDADPAGDFFGRVFMNGDGSILAMGASSDEENGGAGAGSVYIFQSGSSGYQQVQKLTASGDADPPGDFFGTSLSISSAGNILAVGAPNDEENGGSNAGSVYIFQSGSGGYQQVQKLTASGDADPAGDRFGHFLSINSSGNILAVGAPNDEENGAFAGSVYIFQSGSGGYQQVQKLTASGDANPASDFFGQSISINSIGDIVAIGAASDEENGSQAGSVYIFQSGSGGYQQVQKLTASGDADPAEDYFGTSLSISSAGNILAVGAPVDEENGGSFFAGSVYIFQSGSGGYQQVQKLTASGDADPAGDRFGTYLSCNSIGDTLAVGAPYDEENGGADAGSVYIFQSGSGGYQQVQKLTASFGTDGNPEVSPEGDRLGDFIALNSAGTILAAGARRDEENGGANAGSVYIFRYTRDY